MGRGSSRVPAGGAMPRDDLALAIVLAVVRLQSAYALAGQAVHHAVARVAQALRLPGPRVHHTAGELVAGHKLTRLGVIG